MGCKTSYNLTLKPARTCPYCDQVTGWTIGFPFAVGTEVFPVRPAFAGARDHAECSPDTVFCGLSSHAEADHSSLSSTELKKAWSCTSTPPYM
jgi:hypothetical protein